MRIIATGLIALSLLYGCAGGPRTTNPREGGLFSYDPQAYQKRLDERRSHLSRVEQDTAVQKQQTARLQKDLAGEKQKLAVLDRNLGYLDNSLNTLQQRLDRMNSSSHSLAKKQEIERRIHATKKSIWRMQRNVGTTSGANYSQKESEYKRLKNERDLLLKEAELLEQM